MTCTHAPRVKLEYPKYWYCEKCLYRLDYKDGEWIAQDRKHEEPK